VNESKKGEIIPLGKGFAGQKGFAGVTKASLGSRRLRWGHEGFAGVTKASRGSNTGCEIDDGFLRRLIQLASQQGESQDARHGICQSLHSVDEILSATAAEYGVDPEDYVGFRSGAAGRDVAAYLCRGYTTATLAELSNAFGLSHRDRSCDLVKRARHGLKKNKSIEQRIRKIEKRLRVKPESRV
jgi:hypothetical protein